MILHPCHCSSSQTSRSPWDAFDLVYITTAAGWLLLMFLGLPLQRLYFQSRKKLSVFDKHLQCGACPQSFTEAHSLSPAASFTRHKDNLSCTNAGDGRNAFPAVTTEFETVFNHKSFSLFSFFKPKMLRRENSTF